MNRQTCTALLSLSVLAACGRDEARSALALEQQRVAEQAALAAPAAAEAAEAAAEPTAQAAPVEEVIEELALEAVVLGAITPLHRYGDIWLGAQPTTEDFTSFQAAGVKTVINLRHAREQVDFDEAALMDELGIDYVHMPWAAPDELTDDIFEEANRLLSDAERPLLLHCASSNRVGALWACWRSLHGDVPIDDALAEGKQVGLRNAQYESKTRDYVQRKLAE